MANTNHQIINKAKKLNTRYINGKTLRLKDGCSLAIFNNQVVLWGTADNIVASVNLVNNTVKGELITLKDFETYLDRGLKYKDN